MSDSEVSGGDESDGGVVTVVSKSGKQQRREPPPSAPELRRRRSLEKTKVSREKSKHKTSSQKLIPTPDDLDVKKAKSATIPIPPEPDTGKESKDDIRTTSGEDDRSTDEVTSSAHRSREASETDASTRSSRPSSRISRVMRQLLCCGVAYNAASEDEVPNQRHSAV